IGRLNNCCFGRCASGFEPSNNLRSYRETKRGAFDIGITVLAILSLRDDSSCRDLEWLPSESKHCHAKVDGLMPVRFGEAEEGIGHEILDISRCKIAGKGPNSASPSYSLSCR